MSWFDCIREIHENPSGSKIVNGSVAGFRHEAFDMSSRSVPAIIACAGALGILCGVVRAAQDRYALTVPNGLAFAEFRGYDSWPVIAVSEKGGLITVILGNAVMINAYKDGFPGSGKSFPDGSKLAKIRWNAKKNEIDPGQPMQPGTLHDVNFMVKDSKRFPDSGGWGWAVFKYDTASNTFTPNTPADTPPQGNDAQCGLACHMLAKDRDYVFTAYPKR